MVLLKSAPVVIDNGTCYTKLGFSGFVPQEIIHMPRGKNDEILNDFDFMEDLWHKCIYDKLRCNPEDHHFLLTEPIFNPPDQREQTAEIMFETFNIPGLHISVQPILSLVAAMSCAGESNSGNLSSLSGLVLDSGETKTSIIPIAEGHVMGNYIEKIEVGGRHVTNYLLENMRETNRNKSKDLNMEVAKTIKEQFCYICSDVDKEIKKYDENPEKFTTTNDIMCRKVVKEITTGKEKFLSPDIIFDSPRYDNTQLTSLAEVVNNSIALCPIDTRKKLYNNIVLSGGNTQFRGFGKRLYRDVKKILHMRSTTNELTKVRVHEYGDRRYSAWLGGSILASTEKFQDICITKAQYEEEGTRLFRKCEQYHHV